MKVPYLINIQKYAIHDGNGIRTTVFFKGCPLTCRWCHNPESQLFTKEILYNKEKCNLYWECEVICPNQSIHFQARENSLTTDMDQCNACGKYEEFCRQGARKIIGKQYTIKELVREITKDQIFYESSQGGVTLSGDEVMVQDMDYIENLMKTLYRQGYSINIDTCGMVPYENFKIVLPYTDTFLFDLKIIDKKKHIAYTDCNNEQILSNFKRLCKYHAKINIRIPLIEGVNTDRSSIREFIDFVKENGKTFPVNLLPYHDIGKGKYIQLDRTYPDSDFRPPDEYTLQEIVEQFQNEGIENVKIGG